MENVKKEVKRVLKRYEWSYSEDVIDKMVDKWFKAKKPLMDLFSKHPNWNNEKYYISFDVDFKREIDSDVIYTFKNYLHTNNNVDNTVKLLCSNFKFYKNHSGDNSFVYFHFFDTILDYLMSSGVSNLTSSLNDYIKAYMPELKTKNNQKISRLIHKICTILEFNKLENYDAEFAKFADAINPLKIKRHTVISLNIVDYLLMSNGNSWSSCQTIDTKQIDQRLFRGESCNACWSYIFDASTIVMYTVNKKYNGNNLELQPKINRQLFYYQNQKLLQARLYPQSNDGVAGHDLRERFRNIMQKVIADCLNVPNLWVLKQNVYSTSLIGYVKTYENSTHYPDYLYEKNNCTLSKLKINNFISDEPILIGSDSYCIQCGVKNNRVNSMYCYDCDTSQNYEDEEF